mmetsp:Transcript_19673/g.61902  ORF Transcript_19673/g.61902 Transcript_19673/m.61902 type:complete len:236 (+) Transcript_19673:632-1339(+)
MDPRSNRRDQGPGHGTAVRRRPRPRRARRARPRLHGEPGGQGPQHHGRLQGPRHSVLALRGLWLHARRHRGPLAGRQVRLLQARRRRERLLGRGRLRGQGRGRRLPTLPHLPTRHRRLPHALRPRRAALLLVLRRPGQVLGHGRGDRRRLHPVRSLPQGLGPRRRRPLRPRVGRRLPRRLRQPRPLHRPHLPRRPGNHLRRARRRPQGAPPPQAVRPRRRAGRLLLVTDRGGSDR